MKAKRSAFTLVETLIVVVIMAVLAATIIPQLNSSTKDAQESTVIFNLQAIRSQVELYKAHHSGNAPSSLDRLTVRTNSSGTSGTDAATYPFGPYMLRLPENSINNQNAATAITAYPPSAAVSGNYGWLYHSTSGNVYINDANYLTE